MKGITKRMVAAAVLATSCVIGSAPTIAADYPNFTINENSVPGTTLGNPALVADRLNGLYTETFTPTFTGPGSGTFVANATYNVSAYYENDILVPGLLGCALAQCYNLYATLSASGNFSTASNGDVTFVGTSGVLNLFLDPDQSVGGDLLLLSTSDLVTGEGHFRPSLASGDFEIIWTAVMLTSPVGENFFTAPRPFYISIDANGNFTENPLSGGEISGSANAFFFPLQVAEPNTVLLLGIALLGLGFTMRRRRN
jgi:hypothetical protein